MTNQKQVREAFWGAYPDLEKTQRRARKTQNDYPADTRMAFVDFVDMLSRNDDISEALAQRVTL